MPKKTQNVCTNLISPVCYSTAVVLFHLPKENEGLHKLERCAITFHGYLNTGETVLYYLFFFPRIFIII